MKELTYTTSGTCSRKIHVHLEGDKIQSVEFEGGCSGNTQGICSLVKGMSVQEVIERCKGIKCGAKPTSCPDQLAKALEQAYKDENAG